MGFGIIDETSAAKLKVNTTSQGARVELYAADGSVISVVDRVASGITPGTTAGIPLIGADYKTPTLVRSSSDGALITGDRTLLLYDRSEGAAVDTNKWIQTAATMTIVQATGVITFNNNNTLTTTTGAMHQSHRFFPFPSRTALVFKARFRATAHTNNNLIELGFASPASSTSASIVNGAVWRKDASGNWSGVVSVNGTEILGTLIPNATWIASFATTDYAIVEIFVQNNRVSFQVYTTAGVLAFNQRIDVAAASTSFQQTHLQAMVRTYNSGTVAVTAVQLLLDDVAVWASDFQMNKAWAEVASGMSYGGITSPTAYTQLQNYVKDTAPTARTFSGTASGEATLGGRIKATAMAGGNTDLIMFGFQVPSPYTFYVTGVRIPAPLNQVVAVATTATIFSYGLAFNSSAVSLATAAPYPPMFYALGGVHSAAVALAANALFSGNDVIWTPKAPVAIFPSRFLHVITRALVGTATATETFEWAIQIDGYFE